MIIGVGIRKRDDKRMSLKMCKERIKKENILVF